MDPIANQSARYASLTEVPVSIELISRMNVDDLSASQQVPCSVEELPCSSTT
jgi:hypothetical protein